MSVKESKREANNWSKSTKDSSKCAHQVLVMNNASLSSDRKWGTDTLIKTVVVVLANILLSRAKCAPYWPGWMC